MRIAALVAIGLALACHAPALAQTAAPAPVPISEWPLEKISAMGQEIYGQDLAAWVATDALLERFGGSPPPGLGGWIVVPDGEDQRVRFVALDGDNVKPGWDVVVRNGRAGPVEIAADGVLTDHELARFRARQTAGANIGPLRCRPNMNSSSPTIRTATAGWSGC